MPALYSAPFPFTSVRNTARLREQMITASKDVRSATSELFQGLGTLQTLLDEDVPYDDHDDAPRPHYWSLDDKSPSTLKFVGQLDIDTPHTKIGPYFDNAVNKVIKRQDFVKMKAILSVVPLPDDSSKYPEEATACALEATKLLQNTAAESEVVLKKYLKVSKNNLFLWHEVEGNEVAYLKLQTDALLDHPDSSHGAARHGVKAKTLHDPFRRYHHLFRAHPELAEYEMTCPIIKDRTGKIIPPEEYYTKLASEHGTPVVVEVTPRVWEIHPGKRSKTAASRTYQLIIQTMQLLPLNEDPSCSGSDLITRDTPFASQSTHSSSLMRKRKLPPAELSLAPANKIQRKAAL